MTPKTIKIGPSKMDLQINYENGATLIIPSSFLRKFSPQLKTKKSQFRKPKKFNGISILKLESVGNYAIRVHFSDGHNTGFIAGIFIFFRRKA